jgi:heme iron utilization protein
MAHESRLTRELRDLLQTHRVAALGTLSDEGTPFVSMVPFALAPTQGWLVIHVSGLAAHTRYLTARPAVSLMVMQPELAGEPVHALPRVTMEGLAKVLEPDANESESCRAAYLRRFPDAEHMTQLGDFRFVAVEVKGGRHVAGFGAARSIDAAELRLALAPEQSPR